MRWRRALRYAYLRFVRLKGTPKQISRGFAIGVFWGMFPLPGLQMAVAVVTAAICRSSKLAAAAGTWLSNPITTLPLTLINFQIGHVLRGRDLSDLPLEQAKSPDGILKLGSDMLGSYLLGCFVTGLLSAVIFYLLGVPIVQLFHKRHKHRHKRHLKFPVHK